MFNHTGFNQCLQKPGFMLTKVLSLDPGPGAASSQGMQYQSGVKSGNWLGEFAYLVSTSFSILFA